MTRHLLLVALFVAGCTRHNEKSCVEDNFCTDPALPFCDVDGSIGGNPQTCIAVSCTPGEFKECRDEQALTCNASGNNLDVVRCERGCSAPSGGCTGCGTDAECSQTAPVCDAQTHDCRRCAADSECPSLVCDATGSCAAEASIVYASQDGVGTACSHTAPCAIDQAINNVHAAPSPLTLRLMPGVYTSSLNLQPFARALDIVASGATFAGDLQVSTDVNVRGMTIAKGLECSRVGTSPKPLIKLRDSSLVDGAFSLLRINECAVDATHCDVGVQEIELLSPNGSFTGDRLRLHSSNLGASITSGTTNVSVKITNSIFDNMTVRPETIDTTDPGSQFVLAFNTFVLTSKDKQQVCPNDFGAPHRTMNFENNIIVALAPPAASQNAVTGVCILSHNVLFPQTTPAPNNIVADPLFVNTATKDFHLQATSPAIDSAVPSAGLTTDHDFEGITRPQGAQPDIGAFERKP